MAFKQKTKSGYVVKQGNTGKVLSRFSGSKAASRATIEVARLHKKNMPKQSNRGKSARKDQG